MQIPHHVGSKEIKDILVLHSDQVKSVLLLQMDKEPLRMAMCAMEDDCSAKIFARKLPTCESWFFIAN